MKSIRRKKCSKYLSVFLVTCTMIAGLLLPAQSKAADSYDKDKKGSIEVTLSDIGTDRENVPIRMYQVGTVVEGGNHLTFNTVDALSTTGVNLNDITTGESNQTAAKTLDDAISALDKTTVATLQTTTVNTDADGKADFKDLDQGIYLIKQPVSNPYGVFSPFLVAIPYMEDGQNWIYDVKVSPKAQKVDTNGSIEVTKHILYEDPDTLERKPLIAPESTETKYYVGLFCDESGTIPYGRNYVKELFFKDSSTATAKFENLPDGTYYVFETEQEGTPLKINAPQKDKNQKQYRWVVGNGTNDKNNTKADTDTSKEDATGSITDNKVQLQDHAQKQMDIANIYSEIPDEYLTSGELSIKKNVIENNQTTTVDDTFYATVYKQTASSDGSTGKEKIQVVQLKQNDTVRITVPIDANESKTTFIVEETDANGNALNLDNFAYEISGEGKVEMSLQNTEGSITLTNIVKDDAAESSTEEEEDEPTIRKKKKETETVSERESKKSKSTKTGDNNPIVMWIAIGAVAALVIIFLIVKRRKSE